MIWLLNGPPRSGKDTVAYYFSTAYRNFRHIKFAKHLKIMTHADYGLFDDDGVPYSHNHFEDTKDEPSDLFFGLTPRQAYIHTSEDRVKPFFGDEFFGNMLIRTNLNDYDESVNYLVSDSGFASEIRPLIRKFGESQIKYVEFHRPNCDFNGDSRSYLKLEGIEKYKIVNDGTVEQLLNNAKNIFFNT